MAEGGGVVELSLTTDLVSNLQLELDGAAHEGPLEIEREDANHLSQRTGDSGDAIREQSRLRES